MRYIAQHPDRKKRIPLSKLKGIGETYATCCEPHKRSQSIQVQVWRRKRRMGTAADGKF
jgi:hypothetical protein